MRYILSFFFCLSLVPFAFGQKIRYGGMQQMSISVGEHNSNFGFVFINGVRFNRFFAGIGSDIQFGRSDNYQGNTFRTSSVFIDGRYYINKKRNLFAKLNGGANYITERFYSYNEYYRYEKFRGYYGAIGFGFKAKLSEEVFYSFDLTYSVRQSKYNYSYWNSFVRDWQTDRYDLRRSTITLCMGIEIQ